MFIKSYSIIESLSNINEFNILSPNFTDYSMKFITLCAATL